MKAQGILGLVLILGAVRAVTVQAQSQVPQVLTLDHIWLGHTDPVTWEPGDASYTFPVAAHVFYGFSPLKQFQVEVSENCKRWIQVHQKRWRNLHARTQRMEISLSCAPYGNESRRFTFTLSSQSFGQVGHSNGYVILGTSFKYAPLVNLRRVGPTRYFLEIREPQSLR